MAQITRSISFDAGIEQILTQAGPELNAPSDSGRFVPAESHYTQQLTEVLLPPSIEQMLLDSFRPAVTNRELLTPVGYQAAHEACKSELGELKQEIGTGPSAEKLGGVLDLLDEDSQLRELLTTYRHLLHQA